MEQELRLLFVSPLLISGLFGLVLAIHILRRRGAPGFFTLAILALASATWSIGYAAEMLLPGLEVKIISAKVQYLGIAVIPAAWFLFSVERFAAPGWFRKAMRYRLALLALPVITCTMVWTNELHNLVWSETGLVRVGPVQVLGLAYGPYFWVNFLLGYVLILWGSVRMGMLLSNAFMLYRWQTALALLAITLPWLANLAYVLKLTPVPGLDWTPFAVTVSTFIFSLNLVRFQLINILPIAQAVVLEGLPDCLLVLDAQQRIIELNPAARRLLLSTTTAHQVHIGSDEKRNASRNIPSASRMVGMPLNRVKHPIAAWVEEAGCRKETQRTVELAGASGPRYYELQIQPFSGPYPDPVGCLVVLHDITRQRQDQATLEQARDRLEHAVAQRTARLQEALAHLQSVQELERRHLVTELHDRVGQNLAGLSLNLHALRSGLGAGADARATERLDNTIRLLEETTRQVRGVMADLYPPMLEKSGLVPALRWYCDEFTQRCGIPVFVSGEEITPRLPAQVEMALFRMVQESLNNALKHARAGQVYIHIDAGRDAACITVTDDGQGFDANLLNAEMNQPHWGLITMHQRAESVGCELQVETAPGQGTCITMRIRRDHHAA